MCSVPSLLYKEHAWVTVAAPPAVKGKQYFLSFWKKILETLFVTFSQKYVKYFFGQFPFLRNFNPSLDESPHCLGLAVNGNHKLVSACNKGSTDPFVENDQQM